LIFFILGCGALYHPDQIRLAWTENIGDMMITWNTVNTTADDYVGVVKYGTSSSNMATSAAGYKEPSYTCFNKAPIIHHVLLKGLTEATTYYYSVGSEKYGFSKIFTFETQPTKNTYGSKGFRFGFYGDMGIDYSNFTINRVAEFVDAGRIDAVFHIGDISYADDRVHENKGTSYQDILNKFYNMVEPISARVPYMTTPGNHERLCDFADYKARNLMPYKTSDSETPMYYSFQTHRVYFIGISTEQHLQDPNPYHEEYLDHESPQYKWLVKELKQASEMKANGEIDWIIAYGHRPMYCSFKWSGCCWGECESNDYHLWKNKITENIEDVFHSHGVDFYLCGHTHTYERTWPVYKNKPFNTGNKHSIEKPQAMVEIMAGAPGDMEDGNLKFVDPQPAWSTTRISSWNEAHTIPFENAGFGYFQFFNSTHARFEYYKARTGELMDHFWLIK